MITAQHERIKSLKERIDKLPPRLKKKVISKIYELGGLELLLGSYIQNAFEGGEGGFSNLISSIANNILIGTIDDKLDKLEKLVSCLENTQEYGKCEGIYPQRQWEKILTSIFANKNIMLIILLGILFGIFVLGGKHGKA
jgi:hypothetical protein